MYSQNGQLAGFSDAAGFDQRLREVAGILCGTATSEGIVHVVRRTAETVDRLGEGLSRTERAIGDLASETRVAISGLASQVKDIAASQGARLTTLEAQRDGARDTVLATLLNAVWWAVSKGFLVIVAAAAVVWAYLNISGPHLPLSH